MLFVQHISKNGCRDIVWTPVKNHAFTADVNWTRLDRKYSGTILSPGIPAVAKPAALYELKDQDAINVLLRAQRNFYARSNDLTGIPGGKPPGFCFAS